MSKSYKKNPIYKSNGYNTKKNRKKTCQQEN